MFIIRSRASSEKVENVVNAPRIPTVRNFWRGSLDTEDRLKLSIAIPMKNEPIILIMSILKGKFVPNMSDI